MADALGEKSGARLVTIPEAQVGGRGVVSFNPEPKEDPMTPFISRSFAAAVLTLATVAHAQSTSTTSSNTSTSTSPSTTTTTTQTTSPGTMTTSPTSVAPRNPTLVRNPTAITNPVPGPVVPPTTSPSLPAQAVDPLNNAATNVTRPLPANAAQQAANSNLSVPPGSTNASTMLDANGNPIAVSGASIDALAAAGVDVALDPATTVAAIRRADRTTQQAALAQVRTRIDATSRALTELRAQARANGVAAVDSNFDQAAAEIRNREDLLRDALRDAGSATSDEAWRQAQSQIATQYQAYAEAVRRAQQMLQPRQS
ncbi:MAG: hypothetical protein C0518_07970 [Opitutus sp.]|nr:hypothetical protein [Opitutus sp.]